MFQLGPRTSLTSLRRAPIRNSIQHLADLGRQYNGHGFGMEWRSGIKMSTDWHDDGGWRGSGLPVENCSNTVLLNGVRWYLAFCLNDSRF